MASSQDTFCTALINAAPPDGLALAGVEGSLLTEETNRKTMDKGKGTSLVVRGRANFREKGEKRNQSQNKSRNAKGKSDIECYHCEGDSSVSGDIYFLKSTIDSDSLTATNGHALSDWIIDSGTSLHVSPHREWFTSYVSTKDDVRLRNEQTCQILGVGDVQLKFQNGSSFMPKNVRHVPAITKSLINTDSDYAGDLDNRRPTSGYVFTMAGGAVSWRSRLQTCVTQSTTEAEYVAASEACKEAIWLGRLVTDLRIKEEPLMLHCDSQSAIQLARNPVYHSKTKHVDVKYHFIREMVENKQVQLVKVHTTDNLVDLLTKGLPGESFAHCRKLLGIG
ncbi:hypothetical protein L7F22_049066 [Adiantum nelumboides]|nr:hypothetical protein [Adiantum nelumboides]